jgi:hypothetical protein
MEARMRSSASRNAKTQQSKHGNSQHPHGVPILDADETPAQPFSEGVDDELDPNLRHRLISDVAYQRYVARGYADGYDLDDWLQAESDVDHMLVRRNPG